MSTTTNAAPVTQTDLTREQQWVVHQALVEYAEVALRDDTELPRPVVELSLVDKVEDGDFAFTAFEFERLGDHLAYFADHEATPERDRETARQALARLDRLCPGDLTW